MENSEHGVLNAEFREETESEAAESCPCGEGGSPTRRSASPEEGERTAAAPSEPRNDDREVSPDLFAHFDSLREQGARLAAEVPGFELGEALRDADFLRLTSPVVGLSVRAAWYALHGAEREEQAARRAYERAEENISICPLKMPVHIHSVRIAVQVGFIIQSLLSKAVP